MTMKINENMLKGSSLSLSGIIILCILICTVPVTGVGKCYEYHKNSSGEIVYDTNDSDTCNWLLFKPAFEEHALVLTLNNLQLIGSHDGSILALLYLPKLEGQSNFSTPLCVIYMTPLAVNGCGLSYLQGISFTNQSCNEAFWHVEGGFDYYRVQIVPGKSGAKSFTLKYQFIDCSAPSTTPGKDTATQSSQLITSNSVTALHTTRDASNEGKGTAAQSSTPIITNAVLGVLLAICILVIIVQQHRLHSNRNRSVEPQHQNLEGAVNTFASAATTTTEAAYAEVGAGNASVEHMDDRPGTSSAPMPTQAGSGGENAAAVYAVVNKKK